MANRYRRRKHITVEFKPGYRPPHSVSAEGAATAITELLGRGRDITTSALVEASEPEASPIHGICTWDDAIAADLHRRQEARMFIRGVIVSIEASDPQPFIHVPTIERVEGGSAEGRYVLLSELAERPDEFQMAFDEARRWLTGAEVRVRELAHIAGTNVERRMAIVGALEPLREAAQEMAKPVGV